MNDMSEAKRMYQAEVHLALGAVIQGITVAALGNELASVLRDLSFPEVIWFFATGLQSLLLCIAFWYTFMNNYFFGFRAINLTARSHLFFAAFYIVLGLEQLLAIHFLDMPRLWMTFYVLLIATTLVGSWTTAQVKVIDESRARQAMEYDPGSRAFMIAFFLTLGCLTAWYAFPGIDSTAFRIIALSISGMGLVLFIVYYIQVFQRHLEVT